MYKASLMSDLLRFFLSTDPDVVVYRQTYELQWFSEYLLENENTTVVYLRISEIAIKLCTSLLLLDFSG